MSISAIKEFEEEEEKNKTRILTNTGWQQTNPIYFYQ